jgi:uncharacterized repeat protein (TIGR03803 family)
MLRGRGIPDLAGEQAVSLRVERLKRAHAYGEAAVDEWIVRLHTRGYALRSRPNLPQLGARAGGLAARNQPAGQKAEEKMTRNRPSHLVLFGLLGLLASVAPSSAASRMSPGASQETLLYAFQGGSAGRYPRGGLVADHSGALYGVTGFGNGVGCGYACGTVFKLTPMESGYAWRLLYRFEGGADGSTPTAALIRDERGALYGTTSEGGTGPCQHGCGTVFKLTPTREGYAERILYRFRGGSDGLSPFSKLVAGRDGALYGTTDYGGSASCSNGCGTVFKLTPSGSGYVERVIYRFQGGSTDGMLPVGDLIADEDGNLYGATIIGGNPCGGGGCGLVFKLSRSKSGYTESILYRFQGGHDGAYPSGGLIADEQGALYGTTVMGGNSSFGFGTVFKLARAGSQYTETVLYAFRGGVGDGVFPHGSLIRDADGALYGTTTEGGHTSHCAYGCGVVFKLSPTASGYSETIAHFFDGKPNDGATPSGALLADTRGRLYGTTETGGALDDGTVFRLKP